RIFQQTVPSQSPNNVQKDHCYLHLIPVWKLLYAESEGETRRAYEPVGRPHRFRRTAGSSGFGQGGDIACAKISRNVLHPAYALCGR
ncbi:hypothetical protein, partial [Alistipes communis]|uniref:hypothetical protein n=1 Tax=Alistipes communis TaxID=2585118 RepID=UPI003A86A251